MRRELVENVLRLIRNVLPLIVRWYPRTSQEKMSHFMFENVIDQIHKIPETLVPAAIVDDNERVISSWIDSPQLAPAEPVLVERRDDGRGRESTQEPLPGIVPCSLTRASGTARAHINASDGKTRLASSLEASPSQATGAHCPKRTGFVALS